MQKLRSSCSLAPYYRTRPAPGPCPASAPGLLVQLLNGASPGPFFLPLPLPLPAARAFSFSAPPERSPRARGPTRAGDAGPAQRFCLVPCWAPAGAAGSLPCFGPAAAGSVARRRLARPLLRPALGLPLGPAPGGGRRRGLGI